VAQILTGDRDATADDGVAWVIELCRALDVPPLSAYGMTQDDIPAVITKAARSSSMRGNPIKLTPHEMEAILTAAL
jgi:alcohol dehydrogenase class IV